MPQQGRHDGHMLIICRIGDLVLTPKALKAAIEDSSGVFAGLKLVTDIKLSEDSPNERDYIAVKEPNYIIQRRGFPVILIVHLSDMTFLHSSNNHTSTDFNISVSPSGIQVKSNSDCAQQQGDLVGPLRCIDEALRRPTQKNIAFSHKLQLGHYRINFALGRFENTLATAVKLTSTTITDRTIALAAYKLAADHA